MVGGDCPRSFSIAALEYAIQRHGSTGDGRLRWYVPRLLSAALLVILKLAFALKQSNYGPMEDVLVKYFSPMLPSFSSTT